MNCDLVLEGGGAKISALVGAYTSLRDAGFQPANIAGTSAGAIVGAAIAAGYEPDELKEIILEVDFNSFLDGGRWFWQRWRNIATDWGMYKGDVFEEYMRVLLGNKNIFTFESP